MNCSLISETKSQKYDARMKFTIESAFTHIFGILNHNSKHLQTYNPE